MKTNCVEQRYHQKELYVITINGQRMEDLIRSATIISSFMVKYIKKKTHINPPNLKILLHFQGSIVDK